MAKPHSLPTPLCSTPVRQCWGPSGLVGTEALYNRRRWQATLYTSAIGAAPAVEGCVLDRAATAVVDVCVAVVAEG